MKPILFIKGDDSSNVRLRKFIKYFTDRKIPVSFYGWNRSNRQVTNDSSYSEEYLLSGGGFGGKSVLLLYPIWMIKLFIKLVFAKDLKSYNIVVINFDSALPTYLASRIRNFEFIYEIRDEFAISYNFPDILKRLLTKIDNFIMKKAKLVIHVDQNRVRFKDCNYIVIENSPFDYYNGQIIERQTNRPLFAVIGNISRTRGIDQIMLFAKSNPSIELLVVGKFYDEKLKSQLLSLKNITYHELMPQEKLFGHLKECCAIFSLYDPKIEINRLAASNKVYDAMMLGIPVLTNPEVINSKFIIENKVGLTLNYTFDESWQQLVREDSLENFREIGKNGRRIYLERYSFDRLIEKELLNKLK